MGNELHKPDKEILLKEISKIKEYFRNNREECYYNITDSNKEVLEIIKRNFPTVIVFFSENNLKLMEGESMDMLRVYNK